MVRTASRLVVRSLLVCIECGIETQGAHSVALSWAEALRFASVWNQDQEQSSQTTMSCPMYAVLTVAPVLAQAGKGYVRHLDQLLKHVEPAAPGMPTIQMYDMAERAVKCREDGDLDQREKMHLEALEHLLGDEHTAALQVYMRILRVCPGDAFALVQAMDLAHVVGDRDAAFR